MNREGLKRELAKLGVNSSAYSAYCMDGSRDDDVYTIEGKGSSWGVFYYERGVSHVVKFFDSEDEACRALLDLLKAS